MSDFVLVSRAWRGETPYIKSWCDYYLNTLLFDRVIIIRCDEERFDFLDDDRVEFVDRPSKTSDKVFGALVGFEIPKDFDYVFSCDIDEYLVLHGKTVKEFVGSDWDACFLWWALCCSTSPSTGDLRDNLNYGVSLGHDGKTIFKTEKSLRFHNEHMPQMEPGSETFFEKCDLVKRPYVMHFCSRSLEDLVVRSLWQSIKAETSRSRYVSCLRNPPKDFRDLPVRFKIAYAQSKMEKVPFKCDLPKLSVDAERLDRLFAQANSPRETDLFKIHYEMGDILKGYPFSLHGAQSDFNEIVGDMDPRKPDKIII